MAANDEMGATLTSTQQLLLLHSVPHIGEKTIARLLRLTTQNRFSLEKLLTLEAGELCQRYELSQEVGAYLANNRAILLQSSAELAKTLRQFDVQVRSIEEVGYPHLLDQYEDAPPPLLYLLGNSSLLIPSSPEMVARSDQRISAKTTTVYQSTSSPLQFTYTIAVSNGADIKTMMRLEAISNEQLQKGGVPVTGHDRSPYQRLALTAQRRNSPTIYLLNRGLREALGPSFDRAPFAAARIRDAFFETSRDLAISAFRLDDHSIGANNRRRDRLIFSLSEKIIALEVRAGGTMYAECLRAFKQGRDVSVVKSEQEGNQALVEHGCPEYILT